MRTDERNALIVVGGLMAFTLLLLNEPPRPEKPTSPQPRPKPEPPPMPPPPPGDTDTDDETALARMLTSETSQQQAWPVIGWMALQTAKKHDQTVYQRLTAGQGYGPRVHQGVSRYASTAKPPTSAARQVARQLLAGELQPAAVIRALGHSSWVEELPDAKKQYTEATAATVLRVQGKPANFGGLWARIRGTRWYLAHPKKSAMAWQPGGARAALARVPVIDPLDPATS